MHKSSPLALVPLCCLAVAASAAHLFNEKRDLPAISPETPALVARPIVSQQAKQELENGLHQILDAYRKSGFSSLEKRTTRERWHHWQVTTTGEQVDQRMQILTSWPKISLRNPKIRPSGHIEVLATCGGDQLKVWMSHKEGDWKLIGIVAPPRSE